MNSASASSSHPEAQTVNMGDFAAFPTARKAVQLRRNVRAALVRTEEMIAQAVTIPGDQFDWEKLAEAWHDAKALEAVLISSLESMLELGRFAPLIQQQIDRARDFLDG